MSSVVAIIPARSGSKGVVDKNIRLLAGRPLLAYSITVARQVAGIKRIIVSTDSEYYSKVAIEYGAEVPFLRPVEISADNSTDYEWIDHLLDWMQREEGGVPDYLVHLRPTTPLREFEQIESAIKRLKQNTEATALRSVHEMSESAYKTVEVDNNYLKCICSGSFDLDVINRPRQEFPKTYITNGYVDIYRSEYVLKNKKIFGNKVLAYNTDRVFEIDTLNDFDDLEHLVLKKPTLFNSLFAEKKIQS